MRIVHVVIGGEVAGGQLVALQLARAVGDAAFVAPGRGAFTEMAEREGFPVHVSDPGRSFRIDRSAALARLLRRAGADVLHTHTHLAGNVVSRIGGRLARVPVVAHMHIENHLRPGSAGRAQAALDNATARLCARILCVSEDTRRAYERQGYPAHRLEVVHNGIDLSSVERRGGARVRAELQVPEGAPLVGEIARLAHVKGQRELIEAIARLDGVHLVLVGRDLEQGGAYQAALRRRVEELGVADRVHLAGYRGDPHAVLEALDVFALPSRIEGLPLTVLEAMAHAKPVVATPVGGTPELVRDGETGLLVPPGDVDALAAALDCVLRDPPLASSLGEAGRALVARDFSEEAMTQRVLRVYEEVAR